MFIALMGVGGAERVCVSLANEFVQMGYEVHIVVLNLKNDVNTHLLNKGCIVHELGVSRLRYAAPAMLRFIWKYKPKSMLVFGNEMGIILNILRKCKLIHLKIVLRVLNNINISLPKEENVSPIVEGYLRKQQKQLRDMEVVVAQCEAMKEMLLTRKLVETKQIHAIYNPVSPKVVDAVETLPFEKKAYKQLTFIGRLDPQKNIFELLEAFAKLLDKRGDIELHLVGDGVLTNQIKEKTVELHIQSKVIFEGVRKDIEKVYKNSDAVVLASNYEGMPNCLIEAIACGVPIVSYDCPIGPREIVVDGVNGFLVLFHDIDALAQKMEKVLNVEWDREKIKETATKFSAKKIAEQYRELLG